MMGSFINKLVWKITSSWLNKALVSRGFIWRLNMDIIPLSSLGKIQASVKKKNTKVDHQDDNDEDGKN